MSPVKSIFIESFLLTFLDRATMGVEQNRPILTPGVANFAEFEETAKSHEATNWQPAAVAIPLTSAITGLEQLTINCIKYEQVLNNSK